MEEKIKQIFNQAFEISLIETSEKFQIRKTKRDQEEFKNLVETIKSMGQVEPIHLVVENGKYFIIAGFGRFEAMRALKFKTCKAIIYPEADENEIMKIVYGTNIARSKLSEWDKIAAIGEFRERNHNVQITSKESELPSIEKVFGIHPVNISKSLAFYGFFRSLPDFLRLFGEFTVQLRIIDCIYNNLKIFQQDTDYDIKKIVDFVKNSIKSGVSIKEFNTVFPSFLEEHVRAIHRSLEEAKIKASGIEITKEDEKNLKGISLDPQEEEELLDGLDSVEVDSEELKLIGAARNVDKEVNIHIATLENIREYIFKSLNTVAYKNHGDLVNMFKVQTLLSAFNKKMLEALKNLTIQREIVKNSKV